MKIDVHDKRCLQKHASGQWIRDNGRSFRQGDLEARGLLRGELRVIRESANGNREYRKHYQITDAGQRALKEAST